MEPVQDFYLERWDEQLSRLQRIDFAPINLAPSKYFTAPMLYLVEFGVFVKIGISINPNQRMRGICKSHRGARASAIMRSRDAASDERLLHWYFRKSSFWHRNEWFYLKAESVIDAMNDLRDIRDYFQPEIPKGFRIGYYNRDRLPLMTLPIKYDGSSVSRWGLQ